MGRHHLKSKDALLLVVQVGFAGARSLFDSEQYPDVDADKFEQQLVDKLSQTLAELPKELNVQDEQLFFCGISQIAVGGDTVFTTACQNARFVQRIFFPQHRDVYLTAEGSDGPDFTSTQRDIAAQLLESPHVIQERLVSDSPDRHARFRDTNVEIVRVSDLLICMTRKEQASRAGGTHELVELAAHRRRPVLQIEVAVDDNGEPELHPDWKDKGQFKCPKIPNDLAQVAPVDSPDGALPDVQAYARR